MEVAPVRHGIPIGEGRLEIDRRKHLTESFLQLRGFHPQGGIPAAIALSLGTAQRSIDAAVYEFDLNLISDALLAAAGRGVAVRRL